MDCERDPYQLPRVPFLRDLTQDVRASVADPGLPPFYSGPEPHGDIPPVPYNRLVVLASQRQRFCAIIKDTNLTSTHLQVLDAKKFYLIEKLARARYAGCLQNSLNKIDLSKVEAWGSKEPNLQPNLGGQVLWHVPHSGHPSGC